MPYEKQLIRDFASVLFNAASYSQDSLAALNYSVSESKTANRGCRNRGNSSAFCGGSMWLWRKENPPHWTVRGNWNSCCMVTLAHLFLVTPLLCHICQGWNNLNSDWMNYLFFFSKRQQSKTEFSGVFSYATFRLIFEHFDVFYII